MLGYNDFLIAFIGQIGFVVLILTIRVLICSSEFSYTFLKVFSELFLLSSSLFLPFLCISLRLLDPLKLSVALSLL